MSDDVTDGLDNIDYSQLRKHNRYSIITPCKLLNIKTNIKTESFLTTISLGGISFIFPELIPVGTVLNVEFEMPNGAKVNKYIEVKRFNKELHSFKTPIGSECIGFEHGSKFVAYQVKNGLSEVIEDITEVATAHKPIEEIFTNCFYHLEMYRNNSNILRHAYVVKASPKHVCFNTLVELQLGETINANMVIVDNDNKKEEELPIEIQEITKEGKLFSVKGLILK